jgi:hypothetical protein
MLQVGSAGVLGLTLPQLLQARESRQGARADHCIVIFLNGGPSHLDMWDMKPEAPAEVRGQFKPIASSVPGIFLSEHLPRLAKQMHHGALIRSAHHSVNNAHAAAVYVGLTGHDRGDAKVAISAGPNDYPAIGSVMAHVRPPEKLAVPFVSMPYITKEGAGGPPQPGFFGGWLGRTYDPLFVLRDPNAANFGMPELAPRSDSSSERLAARQELLQRLARGPSRTGQDMSALQARAFDLLTGPAVQQAFQLDREPADVRQRYGRNIYGQSVLLARRLIEAGTRVASISWAPDANATWDTHGNNFTKLKNELLPQLDAAVSSLLADLAERGLLARTVVAVMGEFGRTPKINGSNGGRDHWNFCYSLLLAGGGIKGGTIFGASDRIGAQPSLNPVRPADIIATIYECLGIPADLELHDRLARPFALCPWGTPIRDVIA